MVTNISTMKVTTLIKSNIMHYTNTNIIQVIGNIHEKLQKHFDCKERNKNTKLDTYK